MIITETEHYALIKYVEGNEGAANFEKAMERMMKFMDELYDQGYRPLHYLPRVSGWVCEKPKNI